MAIELQKHFIEFRSPGTFVDEVSLKEIPAWDVEKAKKMAREITERYGATPYGFQFLTMGRTKTDLDSRELKRSQFYFLGGIVETLEDVERRNDPKEETLRWNMRANKIDRVITNTNSWKVTKPIKKNDVVLDWKP